MLFPGQEEAMTEPDLGPTMKVLANYAPELVPYVLLAWIAFGKLRGIHSSLEKLLTIDARIEHMDKSLKDLAQETRAQFIHIRQELVNLDGRVSRIEGRGVYAPGESRSSWGVIGETTNHGNGNKGP